VRRLTCDASLVRIVETEEGKPLDVGRKTRTIPPAIRRALNTRDPGCCFPGCTYRRYLDAHHIEHWADGGETKLSNLVTLCRLHHRLVHEGEITVETLPGGGWRFQRPDGRHFELVRRTRNVPYDGEELEHTHAALGIHIDSNTAATRWRGERMDYELGVWVLCQQTNRARRPATFPQKRPVAPPNVTATFPQKRPVAAAQCNRNVSAETSARTEQRPEKRPDNEPDPLPRWMTSGYYSR